MEPLFYRSAQAVAVTVLSFLSLILCIPPIIWHLTNRNLAASFLVAFVILSDLFNFINALIWPTDNINSWWDGSVLCDIEVKLFIAIQVGMPGALVCIFRNLALVMDTENAVLIPSWGQRLRRIAIDLLFCAVIPVIAMVTHFIVQGNRYYIFGISGCNISYDESWLTIALSAAWPPTICIIAAGYCILVVYRLIKYTSEFSSILRASGSNLTTKRFVRLFSLALVMILFVLPLQSYVFYTNVALMLPLQPYSWAIAHGPDFNTIIKVPSGGVVKPDRWIPIALSVLVFGFFGLGQDAMRMYRSSLSRIGLTRLTSSLSSRSSSQTGKSGSSWYDSLMSKSGNGKSLKKKESSEESESAPTDSHTDTSMSGGLADVQLQSFGLPEYVSQSHGSQTSEAICLEHHSNV